MGAQEKSLSYQRQAFFPRGLMELERKYLNFPSDKYTTVVLKSSKNKTLSVKTYGFFSGVCVLFNFYIT